MRFCSACGARLKSSARRACPNCGARIEAAPEEAVRVERQPVKALAESFPYRQMRPFQKDVLEKIDAALASGKKFIILEAPVGFGKSAVAAALCRRTRSAYVLTSTKQLQDQYSSDFGFTTVMGKSNFTCFVPTSSGRLVACSKGRCEADWSLSDCPHYLTFDQYEDHLKRLCDKDSKCEKLMKSNGGKICTYYKQKWDSLRRDVTVGNYSFFFSELKFTDDLRKRMLLVCDEAHDLERQLVGAAAFTLMTARRSDNTPRRAGSSTSPSRKAWRRTRACGWPLWARPRRCCEDSTTPMKRISRCRTEWCPAPTYWSRSRPSPTT